MKIGFLFGAGAEISYNMPSGGTFALEVFRQDSTAAKEAFKRVRESIDPTTHYASSWLPIDYRTRSIGTFGKSVFESIIKDTIEHNRNTIIAKLNEFDDLALWIVEQMKAEGQDVDAAFQELIGRLPSNVSMSQTITFTDEFSGGNKLFGNHYFSALLLVYKNKKCMQPSQRNALSKILISILQLHIGALGETLTRKINENLFKQKDDEIDLFDDLGEIMQLNYSSTGVAGLEFLLECPDLSGNTDEAIVIRFARKLLENIFASVLDYKTLIDSHWHYLYCPRVEWNKFCKISIFLQTVKDYINKQCSAVDINRKGYYDDLKTAADRQLLEISMIATTNYTDLISRILGTNICFLNGSTRQLYDPYINKILSEDDLPEEKHFTVPLMFTQSGTKPMTCISMSITYVKVYEMFKQSDYICSIGFGFNPDDEHIIGVIRTLVDEGKKLIVVEPKKSISEIKRAKELADKLKVASTDNVMVMYVDAGSRLETHSQTLWIEKLISLSK